MYKRILHRSVLLGAIVLLVIASTVRVAQAASLCVHPKGAGQCHSSIQAAVDAANDGDQIIIRAGKYTEQVTIIDKDLTLFGQEGAIVQAPADMQETLFDAVGNETRPIIGVANAEVTIRNLIVDGLNSAASNPFLEGITFLNAGGVIRNNLIRNIGFGAPTLPVDPDTGDSIYQGDPIVVINFTATPQTVTIAGNHIVNYNDIGIVVGAIVDPNNPTVVSLTAHVLDNTVIGLGANDVIDQWGMNIFVEGPEDPQSFLTGTIRGNRVRDIATLDPFPLPGIGIITFGGINNMLFADNVVENVNVGIEALQASQVQFMRNRFVGAKGEAAGFTGLSLAGSDIQVIENSFNKFETGIFLFVEDEFVGSALNTSLRQNRFDAVGVDVLTGPGSADLALASKASAAQGSSRLQRYRFGHQP
jgi:hypothetical protein